MFLEGFLAERGGFEPPVELLTLQRFSKPPPSATRPSLQVCWDYTGSWACGARPKASCAAQRYFFLRNFSRQQISLSAAGKDC
jgi:hypothetical protein